MRQSIRQRVVVWATLGLCLGLILAVRGVGAQEGGGLEPSFGNGVLTITGDGFKAGEGVTLTIDVGGARQEQKVTADAQGHFELATGIAVRAGASVSIEARGDQGTTMAAITTVPNLLPGTPGAAQPGQLPETGGAALPLGMTAAIVLALLSTGLALRRLMST